MFTANLAGSSSGGGGHLRPSNNSDYGYHRDSGSINNGSTMNMSEINCDPDKCIDSSHGHYKPSAVATAAAVAVCTHQGGDGLSDADRIEKTALEFKRISNLEKKQRRKEFLLKYKACAYLTCVGIVVIGALILIVLAAMGVFNTS